MYDAVVIGVGGVGSFALRALAKQHQSGCFLGIERFSRGHLRGSSHGKTRIYRRAYFEHPSYVPWIEFSLSTFRQLELTRNLSLMQECGTLLMQTSDSSRQMPPLLQASWNSAQQHGIPVEYLSPAELSERYSQFQYQKTSPTESTVGLLEPTGGFLRPELAQEAALQEAEASGSVTIMENTTVLNFQEISGLSPTFIELKIHTDGISEPETIQTRRLLVCMGAWTGQLLPSWAPFLSVTRQLQGWIDISSSRTTKDKHLFGYEHMPTWVMDTPAWPKPLYGVPCDSDDPHCKHWLKVGVHGRNHVLEDPSKNPEQVSLAEKSELRSASTHAFSLDGQRQGGNSGFVDIKPCMYTMTPDSNFLIGVPDGFKNVFGVAGLSGHGFKVTPALGQMMADFVLEKDMQAWKLEFCSPSRFAGS
jgi:sarcosine oxidase